jgi:hypothetical protein
MVVTCHCVGSAHGRQCRARQCEARDTPHASMMTPAVYASRPARSRGQGRSLQGPSAARRLDAGEHRDTIWPRRRSRRGKDADACATASYHSGDPRRFLSAWASAGICVGQDAHRQGESDPGWPSQAPARRWVKACPASGVALSLSVEDAWFRLDPGAHAMSRQRRQPTG